MRDPVTDRGPSIGRAMRRGLLVAVFVGLTMAPAAAQWNEYPTTATEAEAYYESMPDEWLDGPVEYIVLREERSIWNDLETTEQRVSFIEWFWARRDDDPRDDEHPFRKEFYERVAYANQRFRGFPRGWKGDQGRVWATIGRPNSITRRGWSQVVGRGSGPDFEVWTYYTNTRDLGFRAQYGEYAVYFIESRPGRAEIWDPRFGTGSYPPSLRRAFEYTAENNIIDPRLEFEPETTEEEYVRSATEVDLPVEVPLESWGEPGGGGILVVPVRVALSDLLFRTTGDGFAAAIAVELAVEPESGDPVGARKEWTLRLTQEQLAAHGSASVLMAMAVPAEPGTYEARVGVRESVAEATGRWSGTIEVPAEPGEANVALGSDWIELGEGINGGAGILGAEKSAFEPGGELVVAVWPHRTEGIDPDLVELSIRGPADQGDRRLTVEARRWIPEADQLVLEAMLPDDLSGEYELVVTAAGEEIGSSPLTVQDG